MKLMVWNNGNVIEAASFRLMPPYILQRIHTLNHKPYNISRHIALINETAISTFGFATLCRVDDAERIISRLLELSRVSRTLSCPVAMRLDASGALSFEVEQPTLYEGYAVRAKRVMLVEIGELQPKVVSQTSVTVANDAMADSIVAHRGGEMALWVGADGGVISRPWRPIFAVYHGRVYTPAEYDTVEYVVARDAMRRANIDLEVRPFAVDALERMDEVFIVDVMGVTSVASIREHRLLSMVTMRVAQMMEP